MGRSSSPPWRTWSASAPESADPRRCNAKEGGRMGSTSAQGWYLFAFLLGFTLAPAGLVALGWPVALLGFGLLAVAFGGFRSIKQPTASGRAGAGQRVPASLGARAANNL